jgi:hypothetical protein
MPEPFGLTPPDLRATSEHLHDVSGRMKDVLSALRERLAAVGPVWGDDRIGDQFANGDAGHLAQLGWVDGSVEAKTLVLDYYSTGLRGAANSLEQQDDA